MRDTRLPGHPAGGIIGRIRRETRMFTRIWTEAELNLVRRCFAAGSPDDESMADPGFVFNVVCHRAAGDRLARARANEPTGWPDIEWECLAACAYVGLDAIDDDPSDDDSDLIVSMTFAKPDDGPIGFH
jgi:hypothetical protein